MSDSKNNSSESIASSINSSRASSSSTTAAAAPHAPSSAANKRLEKAFSECSRISGTARVIRVGPKFAFLHSDRYGSIFVVPSSLDLIPPQEYVDIVEHLRVDEIVHFSAAEQQNGLNKCRWVALKVKKVKSATAGANSQLASAATSENGSSSSKSPQVGPKQNDADLIENIRGVVLTVHERFAFVITGEYGRVYLPLSVCFCAPDNYSNDAAFGGSEFQKLTDSFSPNDLVIFDAQKQPEKNGCKYAVVKVKEIISASGKRRTFSATDQSSRPAPQISSQRSKPPLLPLPNRTAGFVSRADSDSAQTSSASLQQARVPFYTGEITKLMPSFGYVKCSSLGAVYFSLSNYYGAMSNNCSGPNASLDYNNFEADSESSLGTPSSISSLLDELSIGDKVRFVASRQTPKNGCIWRGCRVQKMSTDYFGTDQDFDDLAAYLRLTDNNEQQQQSGGNDGASDDQQSLIVMEVSTQTDRHTWNAFLASQESVDCQTVGTQTLPSPEAMLLAAVRRDEELKQLLTHHFPHLMKYVDKNM